MKTARNAAVLAAVLAGVLCMAFPARAATRDFEYAKGLIDHPLEFFDLAPDSESPLRWRQQLPAGYTIRAIDAELFERCLWRDEMAFYAGSTESYLKHGLGYCLLKADEILAEAYASALGKTRAEIGAITQEAYRGRGYAPIASAFLIEDCRQRGYQAYWSCDADHTASIRVAQKLGFRQPRAYAIYEYPPLAS